MGLDMYASSSTKLLRDQDGSEKPEPDFFYWRKHHALDDWMRGVLGDGDAEAGFCVDVSASDLFSLEGNILAGQFVEGWRFSAAARSIIRRDLEFVRMAYSVLAAGRFVVYRSSC